MLRGYRNFFDILVEEILGACGLREGDDRQTRDES